MSPKNIFSLPHEIIIKILSILSRQNLINCSLVNKEFHSLCQDHSLWTKIAIKGHQMRDQDKLDYFCSKIVPKFTQLEDLQISDLAQSSQIIEVAFNTSQVIKELTVGSLRQNIILTDQCLIAIGKCKSIQNLTLTNCYFTSNGECFSNISSLTLIIDDPSSGNNDLDYNQMLSHLFDHCQSLKRLMLTAEIGFECSESVIEKLFLKLGPNLQSLGLHLDGSFDNVFSTNMNKCESLNELSVNAIGYDALDVITKLKTLKYLNIFNGLLSEHDLIRAFSNSKLSNLEELAIERCDSLYSEVIPHIARMCPNLRKVDFNCCYNLGLQGVEILLTKLPQLRCLNLEDCYAIDCDRFKGLARDKASQNLIELIDPNGKNIINN